MYVYHMRGQWARWYLYPPYINKKAGMVNPVRARRYETVYAAREAPPSNSPSEPGVP
jgi:hypothetical protein